MKTKTNGSASRSETAKKATAKRKKISKVLEMLPERIGLKEKERLCETGQYSFTIGTNETVTVAYFNGKVHSASQAAVRIGKSIGLYYLRGIRYKTKKAWEKACEDPSIKNERMVVVSDPYAAKYSTLASTQPKQKLTADQEIELERRKRYQENIVRPYIAPEAKIVKESKVDGSLSRHGVYTGY
jgi:hypothetical protein